MAIKNHLEHYLSRTKEANGCLEWQGALNSDGYGAVTYKSQPNGKLHRIIYQLTHPEESIEGKVIRHTCDNRICINPDHLLIGTHGDNMRDRDIRGRHGLALCTPDEVRAIRKMYRDTNATMKEVAEAFGLKHKTAASIIRGENYAWVE